MEFNPIVCGIFSGIADEMTEGIRKVLHSLVNAIYGVFNNCVKTSFGLLTQTPMSINGNRSAWTAVEKILEYSVTIGTSLMTIFFLIGFVKETINIRNSLNLEYITRLLIRLGVANGVVMGSRQIIQAIWNVFANFAKLISMKYDPLKITDSYGKAIDKAAFWEALIGLLAAFIAIIVAIALGATLLYVVYFRFFKMLVIVPLAPLSLATIAGGGGISHSAEAYIKTTIAYAGEVVVIAVAFVISSAMLKAGIGFGYTSSETAVMLMVYPLEAVLNMAVMVGIVKSAESILRRATGL